MKSRVFIWSIYYAQINENFSELTEIDPAYVYITCLFSSELSVQENVQVFPSFLKLPLNRLHRLKFDFKMEHFRYQWL